MSFGVQEIFDDVNLQIKDNEKVGIIGMNGAGKSTFFKLIMGKLEPDNGRIILKPGTRIGFLPQVISDEIPSMEISVFDYLLEGRPIKKLEQELSEAYMEASTETDEKKIKPIMKRIGKVYDREVRTIISDMNTPLGTSIGNSLEVMEAIDVLQGVEKKNNFV